MQATDEMRMVFCTCPDIRQAEDLATEIIAARLAACVNIIPQLRSVYCWQNAIETADECQLIIKTSFKCLDALEGLIKQHHPYELPELIAVTISEGSAAYLDWMRENTK